MERSFALDVSEVLQTDLQPGSRRMFSITAPLMDWEVHALLLVRFVDGPVATIWFDPLVGGGLHHVPIEIPIHGSHRNRYFRCPRPDHPTDVSPRVRKLYWPVGDPGGFACRRCHRLVYSTSQSRHLGPRQLVRALIAAYSDFLAETKQGRATAAKRAQA